MSRVSTQSGTAARGQHLSDLTARLLRDEPALRPSFDFGPLVYQGQGCGPSLLITDHSEFLRPRPLNSRRDYGMALLAEPGDVVIVRNRDKAYEAYLDRHLGISEVTYLAALGPVKDPLAVMARTTSLLSKRLVRLADGGLTLKACVTTENTWLLAKHLGVLAGQAMYVSGPTPQLLQRTDDDDWFRDLARKVVGDTGMSPILRGYDPAAAAAQSGPTVHLWVPQIGDGLPFVEGVFEDRLRSGQGTFIGTGASILSDGMQAQLSAQATQIATVFQALGFYGVCSLDAVVSLTPDGAEAIHWSACRGYWGDISISMTLAKRLNGGQLPLGFLVVRACRPALARMTTNDCLALFDDLLLCKGEQEEGLIIALPPPGPGGLCIHLLGIGSTANLIDLIIKEARLRLQQIV